MRIVDQHVGQFADADVGFVADRNQFGKPGAAAEPARQESAGHAARLGDDRERPGVDVVHFEHGVHRQRERRSDERMPMQFGPSTRTPPARASAITSSCMRRPSSPVSAKPSL